MHIAHLGPHNGGLFEITYHAATQYPHWMFFWGGFLAVVIPSIFLWAAMLKERGSK